MQFRPEGLFMSDPVDRLPYELESRPQSRGEQPVPVWACLFLLAVLLWPLWLWLAQKGQ